MSCNQDIMARQRDRLDFSAFVLTFFEYWEQSFNSPKFRQSKALRDMNTVCVIISKVILIIRNN